MTDGWNTFNAPVERPKTGEYIVFQDNEEQWYLLPADAEQVQLNEVKPMPKVDTETGDWMRPMVCTSDGTQLLGIVNQARTSASESPSALAVGIYDFETKTYQRHSIFNPNDRLVTDLTLTPDESHTIFGYSSQIQAFNLKTGELIHILEVQGQQGRSSVTIAADGYLYYCTTRDERNIWLSEIDDVPMQTTDN